MPPMPQRLTKPLKHINTSLLPVRSTPHLPYVPTPLSAPLTDLKAYTSLTCVAFDRLQICNAHIDQQGGLDACASSLADESDAALMSLLVHLETLAYHLGWARILDYNYWFPWRSPREHLLMGQYLAMIVDSHGPVDDGALMPHGDVVSDLLVASRELQASRQEAVNNTCAAFQMYLDHFQNEWIDELPAAAKTLLESIYVLSKVLGLEVMLGMQWFGERRVEEAQMMRLMIAHHIYRRAKSFEEKTSMEAFVYAGMSPVGDGQPSGASPWEDAGEYAGVLALSEELDRNLLLMDQDPDFKWPT